jgi:hypothetical protein
MACATPLVPRHADAALRPTFGRVKSACESGNEEQVNQI